jgi:hypothetical protein
MNLKEAIEIIKREGYNVQKVGDEYKAVRPCTPNEPRLVRFSSGRVIDIYRCLYTAQELISWARCYTSDSKRNTKFKSTVKFFDHRKNRRKTKQCLKHELYDNIPSKKAVYRENRWNWD